MKCLQCLGDISTAQPPPGILNTTTVLNGENTLSASVPRAVSVSPSQRRNAKSPTLAATASLRGSLEKSSLSSRLSSGVPGPGYYSGKALKWLGENVLNGLEHVVIMGKTYHHTALLRRWGKRQRMGLGNPKLPLEKKTKLFRILEDALEMLQSVDVDDA